MRRSRPLGFCVLGSLLLSAACAQKTEPAVHAATEETKTAPLHVDVPRNREADDLGRFLAGMPAREGSPFLELQQRSEWQEHARASGKMWGTFERDRLPALREFVQQELAAIKAPNAPLFYPFGGPDSLTVTTFFPGCSTYVLVGLEPPGTIPAVRQFRPDRLGAQLADMRGTLESLLIRSFFVTRQMDQELRGQVTDGVLPDILVELVRGGVTILGARFVAIDEKAQVVDRPAGAKARNRGVVLEFENDADHSVHQLWYLSVNLADDQIGKNPEFFKWVASDGPAVTYLKATSYLTHQNLFSQIRDHILDHSVAVLQDDSGIPYKFFTSRQWRVQLYGEYEQPYGSFRYLVQPDLQKAYRAGQDVRKLNFRIGYGYGRAPSNLLLAFPR